MSLYAHSCGNELENISFFMSQDRHALFFITLNYSINKTVLSI